MDKFYSHCWCMLAAASSEDCNGELFTPLNELPILGEGKDSLLLRPMVEQFDPNSLLKPSPLRKRGWTLQEWELSPKILYFTTYEMFFECRESFGHKKSYGQESC